MRFFIGIVLFLTVQSACFAQSVSSSVKTKQERTVDSLNKISGSIYLENPDSARSLAERALLLSEKMKYAVGIGSSFMNIAHVYWSQSYYPIALFYINKTLEKLPANQGMMICDAYNLRGRIYADLGDNNKALENLKKAETMAMGDVACMVESYSEIALVYQRTGRYREGIDIAFKALKLNAPLHDKGSEAVLYARLSSIYYLEKDFKRGIAYSDTALKISYIIHNRRLRATTYIGYAQIYYQAHDYDKAIGYANMGGALADSIGVVDAITHAYKILIESYKEKQNLQKAMFYQQRYSKMQDSVARFNKERNTQLIQDYFSLNSRLNEMAVTERDEANLKDRMKWQNAVINTLIFSLLAVMAVLVVTYHFYKQKKLLSERLNTQNEALTSQKQVIEAQTADLETLSSVKDKLLAVIAHDLRTPLANLRNMADMFEMDYLTNEEIHKLMKEINPMVKSAELTLSNLLDWAGNQIKGQSINLTQLDIFLMGVEMEQTFNHSLQKKAISFINGASPGRSVTADENHIKVVLRNLISNAIKFTANSGTIKLASEYREDIVIISVEDTGKGMTEEEMGRLFSAKTHFSSHGTLGENGLGIGLMLCKELIQLNGGRLWVTSSPGKGSTFYFSLPLNAEYA